jgi:hypothetical protein
MCSGGPACTRRPQTKAVACYPAGEQSGEDLEQWDPSGPSPLWDDVWDAFERDDETAEPQPEYGDFWGQPDREEEI